MFKRKVAGNTAYSSESNHIEAFSAILESRIHYINDPFKGSDLIVVFNVFYPTDWPRYIYIYIIYITQLASYGEQEVELLANHFKRVLPSWCSIELYWKSGHNLKPEFVI